MKSVSKAYERFYSAYPHKKAPGAAKKAWLSVTKGMTEQEENEFADHVVGALVSQKKERDRLHKAGTFVPQWAMPSTWLNQERWDDRITTNQEVQTKKDLDFCACGEEVVVKYLRVCAQCYVDKHTDYKRVLYDNLVREGLGRKEGEDIKAYQQRCKDKLVGRTNGDRFDILQMYQDFAKIGNDG